MNKEILMDNMNVLIIAKKLKDNLDLTHQQEKFVNSVHNKNINNNYL